MNYCDQNKIEKVISYICGCEYKYFLNKKNVVGIGCGYKIKNGYYTNKLCIQVFTIRKLSSNQVSSQDLIPNFYKGFLTDVIESGVFLQYSFRNKIRPVKGGYAIGNEFRSESTGTLGCLVTDGYNNYILSCNHVLANLNTAPIGTKILQSSIQYGGNIKTDVIAILSKFIPIKFKGIIKMPANYADCAIAKVISKSLVSSEIELVGKPQGLTIPQLNEEVKKVGEVTELTTGKITSINATIIVQYPNLSKDALFKKQIITTLMSDHGDSGSILLDKNNNVIGILISGSKKLDLFSPIQYILKELKVHIHT